MFGAEPCLQKKFKHRRQGEVAIAGAATVKLQKSNERIKQRILETRCRDMLINHALE